VHEDRFLMFNISALLQYPNVEHLRGSSEAFAKHSGVIRFERSEVQVRYWCNLSARISNLWFIGIIHKNIHQINYGWKTTFIFHPNPYNYKILICRFT
jgi:hypothetical protein